MRLPMLRRLVRRRPAAAAAAGPATTASSSAGELSWWIPSSLADEGRSHGQLLLCLALAALSTAGGGLGLYSQSQSQSQSQSERGNGQVDGTKDAEAAAIGTEQFVVHGRRLNVHVSPWLSGLPEGPADDEGPKSGGGSGSRRRGHAATEGSGPLRSSQYVIVGMGVAGRAALRALLTCEPDAEVTVVEAGAAPPGFAEDANATGLAGRLFGGGGGGSKNRGRGRGRVTYLWGTAASSLDADARVLTLSDGSRLAFRKCLLAVGEGRPRVPAQFVDSVVVDRVTPLGDAETRRELSRMVAQGQHVTVLGSNWASVELANYLSDVARRQGWGSKGSVTLIFPESTPLSRELPRYLSGLLMRRLERRGVEVLPHTAVKYVGRPMAYEVDELQSQPVRVYLASKFGSLDSSVLLTDRVVVGGGRDRAPSFAFAGRHGLEVEERTGGLVVSHELMASSSVLAAGDASHFPCAAMNQQRLTVRSADHAYHSGWVAGLNMAGRGVRYEQLPLFFGTIPRLGIRAAWVGQCDGAAETHGFWWRNSPATSNGNANGPRVRRRRTRMDEGQAAPAAAASGTLKDRVKGAFSSLVDGVTSGGRKQRVDNTSSALTAVGIGVGTDNRDSRTGRQIGLRRSTTYRQLVDPGDDQEQEQAGDEEEEDTAAADGAEAAAVGAPWADEAVAFSPVNGAGLVFFIDGDGAVRGVLVWGLPPATPSGDDDEDADGAAVGQGLKLTTTRGGLAAIDATMGGVIERARAAVEEGLRSGTAYKYDMNSRPETLAALKAMALDILGPQALEQLGPKQPLYSYTAARTLPPSAADESLFRVTNSSRSSAEMMEAAYEAAVRGHGPAGPFPFGRG